MTLREYIKSFEFNIRCKRIRWKIRRIDNNKKLRPWQKSIMIRNLMKDQS